MMIILQEDLGFSDVTSYHLTCLYYQRLVEVESGLFDLCEAAILEGRQTFGLMHDLRFSEHLTFA